MKPSALRIRLTPKGRKRLLNDLHTLGQPALKAKRKKSHVIKLRRVNDQQLTRMRPGDVILYAESDALRSLIEGVFFAVVACPKCGSPGLITAAQYYGAVPVRCRSKLCSCQFQISDQVQVKYFMN